MTEATKEHLIDKIKKLLAVTSEAGATEAEAVAAALAAQRLMVANDISEAELWAEAPKTIEEVLVGSVRMDWKKDLLSVVARSYRCACFMYSGNKTFQGVFVGRSSDASAAKVVFESLARLGQKLAKEAGERARKKWTQYLCPEDMDTSWAQTDLRQAAARGRAGFLAGFVSGVASALDKQSQELLVLVPAEVADYMEKKALSTHKPRQKSFSRESFEEGRREGAAAVASGRIEDGGSPRLVA